MFSHLIGNSQVKKYLERMIEQQTIGNSLLFTGPEGVGKSLFAEAFAKALICLDDKDGSHCRKIEMGQHPDIRSYRPEGKIGMHSIASMREFNEEVFQDPFEAKWKIFIIHDAHRMLSYSANALLKTFEEPLLNTIIILVSDSPASLLPTVLSRCRTVRFQPISSSEIASFLVRTYGERSRDPMECAVMAGGSLGQAIQLFNEGENPLRSLLLETLTRAPVSTYKELTEMAHRLADQVDKRRKKLETEVHEMLTKTAGERLSAAQKQEIEKEVEGTVAICGLKEASELFVLILSWYRDLELLQLKGNPLRLFNPDCLNAYLNACPLNLHRVQKAIHEAKVALERSTSLQICLENLFLKLGFLHSVY